MASEWVHVKTVGYTGKYDSGDDYDRRACGGVVHIEERTRDDGRKERRAITSNGRYQFVTMIGVVVSLRGWTAWGDIRGQITGLHAAAEKAEGRLKRDRIGCERQGGYSDASVYAVGDDGYLYTDEACTYPVYPSSGRSNGAVRFEGGR